jgi:holo-[acyl-carrier protein] synthase
MEISVGIDLIEVRTVELLVSKNTALRRVFTKNEIEYCESKNYKFQHYAGRFAAKEATMKALRTGWGCGVQWNHIEILHTGHAPAIRLHKTAKTKFELTLFHHIVVSISHTKEMAIAIVLFY